MSDLEKKAWRLTIFKSVSILIAVLLFGWNSRGWVERIVGRIDSLKGSIDVLVVNDREHAKQDSLNKAERKSLRHDVDSLKKIAAFKVARRGRQNIVYVTEVRDANGHLITKPVNN